MLKIQKRDFSSYLNAQFPTHLLESEVDLRYIQEIYAHKDCKIMEIYNHVSTKDIGKIKSPLGSLNLGKGGNK